MEVEYKLNEIEISFLRALSMKGYPINACSGRYSDDDFLKEWKREIIEFKRNDLLKFNFQTCYWQYDLTEKGLDLQKKYL